MTASPSRGPEHPDQPERLEQQPPFAVRGVIEGFYGRPYSHATRIELIRFVGRHRMNTYVLAAKDEPGQRLGWRRPLPPERVAQLTELVAEARQARVELVLAISPGQTVRYGEPADVEAILARYRQAAELGVTRFALLLDDLPGQLQHPQDRARFGDIATAHAALAGAVFAGLQAGAPQAGAAQAGAPPVGAPRVGLMVCPLVYRGTGEEPYLRTLADTLDPRVDLLWTGRAICSPTLDLLDAATFLRATHRPPLYWDNYPVNDVAMTHELHVGPLRGRDRHLYRFSAGLLANPMDLPRASLLPLATVADYLADPQGYDPDTSWEAALEELLPDPVSRYAYRALARASLGSCLSDVDSPDVDDVLAAAAFAVREGRQDDAAGLLRALAAEIGIAAGTLTPERFSDPVLLAEVAPWRDKFARGGEVIGEVAELLARLAAGTRSGPSSLTAALRVAELLRAARTRLAADPTRIFGDGLDMFLAELADELAARSSTAPHEEAMP